MRRIILGTMTAALMGLGISASSIAAPVVQSQGTRAAATANEYSTPITTGTTTGITTGIGTVTITVGTITTDRASRNCPSPGRAEMSATLDTFAV